SGPVRLLYVGDSALARECLERFGCSIAITEATRGADGAFRPIPPDSAPATALPFDVLVVEYDHPDVDAFAILKDVASRGLQIPVIFVVEWDEELALPALKLGATDTVVKAEDAFRALFFRLNRELTEPVLTNLRGTLESERASRAAIEEKLAEAVAVLSDMGERHTSEMAAASARLAELRGEHESERAQAAAMTPDLGQQISELKAALANARQERESDAGAAAKLLALREAEAANGLAEASATQKALTRRLTDAESALRKAERRLGDRLAAEQEAARH